MRRRLLPLPLAVLAFAAGCGGSGGDPDADPAAIAPARAPVYLEASIKSDKDFEAVAKKLSGSENPNAEMKRLFERAVNENGGNLKWDRDFKPWIGDRIGIYVTSINAQGEDADAALVAPTEDADKAKEFLEKQLREKDGSDKPPKVAERTYKDVKYEADTANDTAVAILDDSYAVIGTEQALKGGIDAQKGEGLAEADAFKKARDQVDDDAVGFGYVKLSALFGALGQQGAAARQVLGDTGDTVAFSIDAEDNAITAESATLGVKGGAGPTGPGSVLPTLPGDAWLAGGSADIGAQFEKQLEKFSQLGAFGGVNVDQALEQFRSQTGIDIREDLLSWMGDAAVYVSGEQLGDLGGALVVKSKDAAKTEAAIGDLQRVIRRFGQGQVTAKEADGPGVDRGIELTAPGLPLPVSIVAAGDRFIVAVGNQALENALKPAQALSDSPGFKDATSKLGDDVEPQLFANIEPIGKLLDGTGALSDAGPEGQRFRKALDQLTTIAAGGKREGDVQRGELVVGVK